MNISFMAKLQVYLSFNPLFSYHNTACENHKESLIHGETLLPEMEKKIGIFHFQYGKGQSLLLKLCDLIFLFYNFH